MPRKQEKVIHRYYSNGKLKKERVAVQLVETLVRTDRAFINWTGGRRPVQREGNAWVCEYHRRVA